MVGGSIGGEYSKLAVRGSNNGIHYRVNEKTGSSVTFSVTVQWFSNYHCRVVALTGSDMSLCCQFIKIIKHLSIPGLRTDSEKQSLLALAQLQVMLRVCQYNFSWWNSATPILVAQYEPSFLTSWSNSMHIFSCICRHFNLPSQLFMLPSFFTWPKHTLIAGWKSYRCCHSASLLLQHQCFGRSWSGKYHG